MHARNGDHLTCPLQCDLCQFRNVQKRDLSGELVKNVKLRIAIRRANLDAFWARAESTVTGNRSGVGQICRIVEEEFERVTA